MASADEDGTTAWVLFQSGVEHVYEVIDEDEERQALTDASQAAAQIAGAVGMRTSPASKLRSSWARSAQLGLGSSYVLPGNNKAVLANALYQTQPLQDVRQPIKAILEACGYEVKVVDADLDFFKSMSQFGVIFIEAHGSPRNPLEESWDAVANTIYSPNIDANIPLCGVQGNEAVLQTSTLATEALREQYKDDLRCGRLKLRSTIIRQKGKAAVAGPYFAVTPNFIRQYDKGTFPAQTLMCLNSCRAFSGISSPWATLLYEKSFGSLLVGWDQRVHYGVSSRALLHLFQFMAGTNDQFAITETNAQTGAKTIYPLLFMMDTPVLPQTVNMAMDALAGQDFDRDPATGARLTASGDSLFGLDQLILAPAIETFQTLGNGQATLTGRCRDNALLRFEDGTTVDIGTTTDGTYTFSLPASHSGPMSLEQEGRNCPPRDLLRWNGLVVTVRPASTSSPLGTCDFTVTYRLSARAIAAGSRTGRLVWSDPDNEFTAAWDPDASSVTWSISGNATVPDDLFGPSSCTWSGGSSGDFNSVTLEAGVTGGLDSLDGRTAWLEIYPPFDLLYTQTCGGLSPPTYACGISGSVFVQVQLGSRWSILDGSETDLTGLYITQWQATPPTPFFESERLPR